ncbi:hypothetical protein PPYR_06547, partial [Photinus pyralis]
VLPLEVANQNQVLYIQPNADLPYTTLKQAIINRTAMSDSQKLKKLLSREELRSLKSFRLLKCLRQHVQNFGC